MKKQKIKPTQIVEVLIRLLFFVTYPALFSTAFTGVKMIVEEIAGKTALAWNSFAMTLGILLIFTICFGRFFCGFACAFGSYGDFIYFLSSKVRKMGKKRPLHLPERLTGILRYGKYLVLAAVLLLCIAGQGTLVSVHSPFSTFSRLHALKAPESVAGLVLFLVVTAGMAVEPRFFCRFLCPMGAIFSLLPVLPVSIIRRDRENCIPKCKACRMACPASLDIPSDAEGDNALCGECFSCGKCLKKCPRGNIHNGLPKQAWFPALLVKAALLFAIFVVVY